jgi:hypothetical protein
MVGRCSTDDDDWLSAGWGGMVGFDEAPRPCLEEEEDYDHKEWDPLTTVTVLKLK